MKIDLELPDWIDDKTIRIFAGIEEVAKKQAGENWQVKVNRCNLCGSCCGSCGQLVYSEGDKGFLCLLGFNRSFNCSAGDGVGNGKCNITWTHTSKK